MPKVVDHAERRREISAVAAALIAAGGLEAATIREIARESGYSKGVVEYYFDNKGEITSGALDWVNQCYEQRVTEATDGLRGLRALRQRIASMLPLDRTSRDEWKVRLVFWGMAAIDPGLRKLQGQRFRKTVALFQRDLEAAVAAGEIAGGSQSDNRARRLVNACVGICTAALHNVSLYDRAFLQAEIDYLVDRVASGKL